MRKLHRSGAIVEAGVPPYGDGEPALFRRQAAAQAFATAIHMQRSRPARRPPSRGWRRDAAA